MQNKLDGAWGDFLAGIDPIVREENDRRFRSLTVEEQQSILLVATEMTGGSRENVVAVLYCELGISHRLAEKLVW